ncbi:MAG: phosphate acyltransferase [Rhodobacterales bacterium]|jgi:phosphate acetyltransferase|nr:phosphate acetyltransferase [Rhodobacter sp.]HBN30787.1 phosphate acetyltransferase [Paracoccaceae bacterium]
MTSPASPFLSQIEPVCPADLLARAQALPPPRVAIARAGAELPMIAAKEATDLGIMTPVFTGERSDIQRVADQLNWDISSYPLIDTIGEADAGAAAAYACGHDQADILMKGQLHSDMFLKTAIAKTAGLRTGNRLIHIFHLSHPAGGQPILITDAAVNVSPDLATRKTAAQEVVTLLHKLGNSRPKIAFLSATESPISSIPSSTEARELRDWAIENIADADFSGPLALDLILSAHSAAIKGMADDPVAGRADAIVVPDIVSGNVLFKALVYLSGGCAAGLITGAKVPLLLTSRSDPPAARLASIALAAVASAKNTANPT